MLVENFKAVLISVQREKRFSNDKALCIRTRNSLIFGVEFAFDARHDNLVRDSVSVFQTPFEEVDFDIVQKTVAGD